MMKDAAAYSAQQPWYPLTEPAEFPSRVTPRWVGEIMHSARGETYLRWHLLPRARKDAKYMAAWRTFWRTMAFADYASGESGERILRRWAALAARRLNDADVDSEEAAIVRRFLSDVEGGLNRIARFGEESMAWAGAEFSKYPPEMRTLTETLVGAIVLHRADRIDDEQLHAVLDVVMLDPDCKQRGIRVESLAAIERAIAERSPLELR